MDKEIKIPNGWVKMKNTKNRRILNGDQVYNYGKKEFEKVTDEIKPYITSFSIVIRKIDKII